MGDDKSLVSAMVTKQVISFNLGLCCVFVYFACAQNMHIGFAKIAIGSKIPESVDVLKNRYKSIK